MSFTDIRLRRGATIDRLSIIPKLSEPIWDTDLLELFIGDGITPGGLMVTSRFKNSVGIAISTSTDVQARVNDIISINTSNELLTCLLPENPNYGDQVRIFDYAGTFDTNPLIVDGNGNLINHSPDDLILTENGGFLATFVESDIGDSWLIIPADASSWWDDSLYQKYNAHDANNKTQLEDKDWLFINSTDNSPIYNLPISPKLGEAARITDFDKDFAVNPIQVMTADSTIDSNGNSKLCNDNGETYTFVYESNNNGDAEWISYKGLDYINIDDLDKPISNATQDALDLKADKATTLAGYGITDGGTETIEPSEILTKLLSIDGHGSGLDADMLDGFHASAFAPISSPRLDGIPTAPTPATDDNSTQIATTAHVFNSVQYWLSTIEPPTPIGIGIPLGGIIGIDVGLSTPDGYTDYNVNTGRHVVGGTVANVLGGQNPDLANITTDGGDSYHVVPDGWVFARQHKTYADGSPSEYSARYSEGSHSHVVGNVSYQPRQCALRLIQANTDSTVVPVGGIMFSNYTTLTSDDADYLFFNNDSGYLSHQDTTGIRDEYKTGYMGLTNSDHTHHNIWLNTDDAILVTADSKHQYTCTLDPVNLNPIAGGTHSHDLSINYSLALKTCILKAFSRVASHAEIATKTIIMFEGSTAPAGWAFCDGSNGTINLTDYFIRFSNIGTNLGIVSGNNKITITGTGLYGGSHTHYVADNFFRDYWVWSDWKSHNGAHIHSHNFSSIQSFTPGWKTLRFIQHN